MAIIKSYTSLEQSKVLKEILPLKSADMCYRIIAYNPDGTPDIYQPSCFIGTFESDIPCWSLAALLNILHFPILSKDNIGKDKIGWMVSVYPDNCLFDSIWYDNPIDPCYEMILKLNEDKML